MLEFIVELNSNGILLTVLPSKKTEVNKLKFTSQQQIPEFPFWDKYLLQCSRTRIQNTNRNKYSFVEKITNN